MPRAIGSPAVLALVLATLAFAVFSAVMAYPWQLAVLAATAIGSLVYWAYATFMPMPLLYHPP